MPSFLAELMRDAVVAARSLVFTDHCALCHTPGGGENTDRLQLCDVCRDRLPRLEAPFCQVCGQWFVGEIPHLFRCGNCAGRRFAFEFARAPFQARRELRELVHRFKYGGQLWLAPTLGGLLADALRGPRADPRLAAEPEWLLVPVPLHARRLREREFNQAEELARHLAHATGLPLAPVLRRRRYTTVQASLDRARRLHNLRGAFTLHQGRTATRVHGRAVLLIDDVFTTGATTQECAHILKTDGGARRVVVLTLARG